MREVTAAADDTRTAHRTPGLVGALLVVGATAFVAVLIVSTGRLSPAWVLYLVPIVIGSLVGYVPGGVIAAAMAAGSLALVAPAGSLSEAWPELTTGLAVFLLSAVVVGAQASRQRHHAEALERVSARDPVTGVRKAEPLRARIAEEIRRSDRYGTDVGVVLVRVQDMGTFTRTFGRYKADLMLEHLADIIRLTGRDTDILGRVGPDSFAVALPNAGTDAAASMARRIADAVHAAEFEGDALEPTTSCRVNVASGSYPADAGTAQALLTLITERLDESSNGHHPAPEADAGGERS